MTLKELQATVHTWITQHGVRYFGELTNVTLLMEEVGEFSRLMARAYGEQSFKPGTEPGQIKPALADELADIIFVITCLANQMDLDLEEAVAANLEKKTQRDRERHHQNPKIRDGHTDH